MAYQSVDSTQKSASGDLQKMLDERGSNHWTARLYRRLQPPAPLVNNPREHQPDAPLGRWNLYLGGAGNHVPGYVNLDLFPQPGVDVAADGARLPFRNQCFTRIECDAVLEHVPHPEQIVNEMIRTLAPGGWLHIVVPFCHPFHPYPSDYRRFTIQGLLTMTPGLEVIDTGWRTGPTATILVFLIEYGKIWFNRKISRAAVHLLLGWALWPLRYLDLVLFRSGQAHRLGNHCYVWLRKPSA